MSSTETSAASPARRGLAVVALLALFISALVLFTRHNGYPYFYHPDEYGKCKQVVDGRRNFNHPLLLLNVAQPLQRLWHKDRTADKPAQLQKAVEAGRTASALFAALAVVALAAAASHIAGVGGGLAAGIGGMLHPFLFEHAHIFKEDAGLTMGLVLSCLAAVLFWKRPDSPRRTTFLGVAVALAISAKYVGATSLALALPLIAFAPGANRARRLGIFAAALVLVFVIVNHQMFTHFGEWRKSFGREVGMSVSGSHGIVAENSTAFYLRLFKESLPTVAMIFLAINALNLATTSRRRSLADWLVFLFPFAFTGLLMCSPRISDRYFLPPSVLFDFNALVGVGVAAEWLTRALGKYRAVGQAAVAAVLLLIGWNGHYAAFKKTYAQFQVDDRHDLEVWMNANLPAGGIVAQDSPVGLPDPEHNKQKGMKREFSQTVLGSEFAADLGTLDELRAKGVRYVATTPKRSVRYTGGEMVPTATAKEEFERRKAFYTALPKQAKLLKQWLPAEIDTLHPGLELYDIGAGQ